MKREANCGPVAVANNSNNNFRTRMNAGDILNWLVLLLTASIIMVPVLWMLAVSVMEPKLASDVRPHFIFWPTFENFRYLMLETNFPRSFLNSVIVSVGHTIIALLISFPAAYALSRLRFRGKELVGAWILLTRCLPPVGVAIPLYLIFLQVNLYNTRIGLMLIYLTLNLSFAVWMLRAFIDQIPREIDEAAFVDGCSRLRFLYSILLPLVSPGLVATAIYVFTLAWNEFVFAFLFTASSVRTAPVEIASYITPMGIQWGPMSAAGVLIIMPVLFFSFLIRKYLISGMTMGAVKE